jgi:hypothetical protein
MCSLSSPKHRESCPDEIVIEPDALSQPQLFHHGEASAVYPPHAAIAIANEQLPGAAAALRTGLHQVAEPACLYRFTRRVLIVSGVELASVPP